MGAMSHLDECADFSAALSAEFPRCPVSDCPMGVGGGPEGGKGLCSGDQQPPGIRARSLPDDRDFHSFRGFTPWKCASRTARELRIAREGPLLGRDDQSVLPESARSHQQDPPGLMIAERAADHAPGLNAKNALPFHHQLLLSDRDGQLVSISPACRNLIGGQSGDEKKLPPGWWKRACRGSPSQRLRKRYQPHALNHQGISEGSF